MALSFSFNGSPSTTYYVNIFQRNNSNAYSSGSMDFISFDYTTLSDFSFFLTENTSRPGFYYSEDFSSYNGFENPLYLQGEIRQMVGASPSFTSDILKGVGTFVWNQGQDLPGLVAPYISEGKNLGTFALGDYITGEMQFFTEYGKLGSNPSGFTYQVFNPSGVPVGTGSLSLISSDPYHYSFTSLVSGAGYGHGNYLVTVSGIYQNNWLKTDYHFTVSTGVISSTSSALLNVTQLGYATGIVDDGTPTSTSFITTLPSTQDDFYNGQIIRFTEDPYLGQGRIISDYIGGTKRVYLNKALGFTPPNGAKIIVQGLGGELNVS